MALIQIHPSYYTRAHYAFNNLKSRASCDSLKISYFATVFIDLGVEVPHPQNSLTHYTISTWSSLLSRLPMDIGCPVSCKFPHGTLHYQSRKVSCLLSRRFYFLPSASHVRIYSESSDFLLRVRDSFHPILPVSLLTFAPSSTLFLSNSVLLPISLATTLGISVDFFSWY